MQTENEFLKQELTDLKKVLVEQNDYIRRINEMAHVVGTVLAVQENRMLVHVGDVYDVPRIPGARIGSSVLMLEENKQPLQLVDVKLSGPLAIVKGPPTGGLVEVSYEGETLVVCTDLNLQPEERVCLDGSRRVVMEEKFEISWDDVGGAEDAKEQLREAIELPFQRPELFARYGQKPIKGVLLYGPPGTGKTLLAKAAATALAKVHGHEHARGFNYVKGPALLSKWVGDTEAAIRGLFESCRRHHKEHGYPGVVFIDEADALLGSRDRDRLGISGLSVPQFLAEMDGLQETGALIILATNRPDSLDAAVVRDRRIDRKIKVGRPDRAAAKKIVEIHLRGKPTAEHGLADWTVKRIYEGKDVVSRSGRKMLMFSETVSGASLAGIVDRATSRAMRRDIQASLAEASITPGISPEDIEWAITDSALQLRDTDLSEFME